jgi:hypothetical protein
MREERREEIRESGKQGSREAGKQGRKEGGKERGGLTQIESEYQKAPSKVFPSRPETIPS